jgi:hypothetical protein
METDPSRTLAELFEKAAVHLQGLVQVASREQLLYLYARYKQVRRRTGLGAMGTRVSLLQRLGTDVHG